jgi:hypothetical protein
MLLGTLSYCNAVDLRYEKNARYNIHLFIYLSTKNTSSFILCTVYSALSDLYFMKSLCSCIRMLFKTLDRPLFASVTALPTVPPPSTSRTSFPCSQRRRRVSPPRPSLKTIQPVGRPSCHSPSTTAAAASVTAAAASVAAARLARPHPCCSPSRQ